MRIADIRQEYMRAGLVHLAVGQAEHVAGEDMAGFGVENGDVVARVPRGVQKLQFAAGYQAD